MCGISGSVGSGVLPDVLAMVDSLHHRGPDASGTRSFTNCTLGHNRLRVIDLAQAADQPMANEDRTIWAVFNGEIYNFRELRNELEDRGHRFCSRTDTEVLLHLYEEKGAALVERLRGMFAFALWDERCQKLVLCRDRLGIKPLYYRANGDGVDFASELRALRRPGDAVDVQSLGAYLRLGWVPGPRTIVDGIRELPPAHVLTWAEGAWSVNAYWSASQPEDPPPAPSVDDIRRALDDAMARHVVADVPVGLFLSSGIDSVMLGALIKRIAPEIRAYTVAFDGGEDEVPEARSLANRLGLQHAVVEASGGHILGSLEELVGNMDQPTVDGVNSWVISRAVRHAGLVVAISGLGGDELFNGYSTFRHVPRIARLGSAVNGFPDWVRSGPAGAMGSVSRFAHSRSVRALEAVATGGWDQAYVSVRGLFGLRELRRLWRPFRHLNEGELIRGPGSRGSDASMVGQLELANYLPYQLLRDTDCMSMAHGLEVRVPLLDDGLVEVALAGQRTLGSAWNKRALIGAVDPSLAFLADRPKRTFTLPFNRWMQGPMRERSRDALIRLGRADLGFESKELIALWHGFELGRVGWRPIWALVTLAVWLDTHVVIESSLSS